ncbi:ABC transporter permease [Streptomyces diastatochromogenes]|nr:ABC transporter permease [Streptomyces diastatochromogenes]
MFRFRCRLLGFRFHAVSRLLVVGGAISYRALFNWTTPPMFIGTLLVGPLLQVFFFVFLGRELGVADDRFHLVGNAVLAASASCVYGGTMAVANERRYGTLGAVLLSPRRRVPLWLGRALPYVLNGLFVSAFVLTAAALVLGLPVPAGALPGSAWCCSPRRPPARPSGSRSGRSGCASATCSWCRTSPVRCCCS